MIYVITCASGKELDAVGALKQLGYTAYAPRAIRRRRHADRTDFYAEILFDGYVFLENEHELTADEYYEIRNIRTVGNFLSRTTCLSETETEYIKTLYNNGEEIGISKGRLENGQLKIESGWCKRFENHIVRWSVRQHKAVVEVTLYGKPHRITCTVDIKASPHN